MTGIAGIISRRSSDECQQLVNAMIESMKYERYYTSGTCFVPETGVYGGWVAHEGSFAVRQSVRGCRNDVTLLFSGEWVTPLPSMGQLVSMEQQHNDRDVDQLLHLYDEEGDRFVGQINGLFSGLLIDRKRKHALLFNDRYGIERIYYYEKDGTTIFASEAKALLRVCSELRKFDDEGVVQFLTFGCTTGERTLFHNVRYLPGGSL
jgi:asparagine synthase (glutamine-hydrolysing)